MEFTLTAADNLIRDGSRLVAIGASAGAFSNASATMTIRDNEVATYRFGGLPDIVDMGRPVAIVVSAADGIMVSLLTTVLGLMVGIPAFMGFNYFTSVINRFVLDVEESAAELIEAVTLQMALDEQMAGTNA